MLDAKTLRERLIASRIASENSLLGCSDDEIAKIESTLNLPLPEAYKDFLLTVGKRAGHFMYDIDFLYPKMLQFRQEAEELLENWEDGKLVLPSDAVVFSTRRGEQFLFFHADGARSDPAIWHYLEGNGLFNKVADSFWDVIEGELQLIEGFRRDYPNSPFHLFE